MLIIACNSDPIDFDQKCDGSLPLEEMIAPNPSHRKLFQDIDRTKFRVWGLTNANWPVLALLLQDITSTQLIGGSSMPNECFVSSISETK